MPPPSAKFELMTLDDYRATLEGTRYQLVEGELLMAPSPNRFHQDMQRGGVRIRRLNIHQDAGIHRLNRSGVTPWLRRGLD